MQSVKSKNTKNHANETIPSAICDKMMAFARSVSVPMGAAVVRQGDAETNFFLLAAGYLFIKQNSADGSEVILRIVAPGEIFGITPTGIEAGYPASAYAATDCRLYAWPRNYLETYCQQYPRFTDEVIRQLTARIHQLQVHTHLLATRSAEEKVSGVVLGLCERAGVRSPHGIEIAFPVTRAQIAQMSGTTLHTASRVLHSLKKDGILSGKRRQIVISNVEKLRRH